MALDIIDKETFGSFCSQVEYKSFIQSIEMAELLQKRGYQTQYLAISDQKDIKVAAILYSVAMAGGLRMEINSGPVVADATYTDRKSTRLNSSHANISYAVFCLKKTKNTSAT